MRKKAVMDFTFLDKCFLAIRPETWKRVNELLGRYGVAQGAVNPKVIRTDTTVVESNIHYPTDCVAAVGHLAGGDAAVEAGAGDSPRKRAAPLPQPQDQRAVPVRHAVHRRASRQSRQQQVKASFRTLIERVEWIVAIAGDFCQAYRSSSNLELSAVALELQAYLPSMQTVAATARRANVEGETVPASERVFSLFEPHTELIKRGRRQKPVEFGHKVLLCETAEKFITDYEVYEQQQPDCDLTQPVIERHEKLFGERPVVLAADKGFCPEKSKFEELAKLVAEPGDPATDAGLHGQVAGQLSGVPRRDRGDYFRLETRVSLGSLFLSRV